MLARYHHLKPVSLEKAATRWPKLQIDFMTIHASKGQQADYVIIVGLQEGSDGFPAAARESIMEEALLPPVEDFPDAEERRLMYVALTRARYRVWALFNKENPSPFVEVLKNWMFRWRENRKKQVAFATCAILFQAFREITLIIRDQNIHGVVEMRRLDDEICRCYVGSDRNVPHCRQT